MARGFVEYQFEVSTELPRDFVLYKLQAFAEVRFVLYASMWPLAAIKMLSGLWQLSLSYTIYQHYCHTSHTEYAVRFHEKIRRMKAVKGSNVCLTWEWNKTPSILCEHHAGSSVGLRSTCTEHKRFRELMYRLFYKVVSKDYWGLYPV
jgi:hypothetical protein